MQFQLRAENSKISSVPKCSGNDSCLSTCSRHDGPAPACRQRHLHNWGCDAQLIKRSPELLVHDAWIQCRGNSISPLQDTALSRARARVSRILAATAVNRAAVNVSCRHVAFRGNNFAEMPRARVIKKHRICRRRRRYREADQRIRPANRSGRNRRRVREYLRELARARAIDISSFSGGEDAFADNTNLLIS